MLCTSNLGMCKDQPKKQEFPLSVPLITERTSLLRWMLSSARIHTEGQRVFQFYGCLSDRHIGDGAQEGSFEFLSDGIVGSELLVVL